MPANPVVEKLRHQIGCLEGVQRRFSRTIPIADAVDHWLPYGGLPRGSIHEVKSTNLAAALAFAAILSARGHERGNIVYIAPDRSLYPLGLSPLGVKPDQLLYLCTRKPQDLAWAVMEALRCSQVSAVIALLHGLDLTASRRLQLAAETSQVTGFLLGRTNSAPIAAPITRWIISPVNGKAVQGFDEPVWAVDLSYCRGGHPGKWILEWRGEKLNTVFAQPVKQAAREALAG